jgi:hypothetical protein
MTPADTAPRTHRRRWATLSRSVLSIGLLLTVGACASDPPPPAWRGETRAWLDTAVESYLRGDTRAADAAMNRARREVASSGRLDLAARVELAWCAARVASTVYEPCIGFEPLRADAGQELQAYADYIEGRIEPGVVRRLPEVHRAFATDTLDAATAAAQLRTLADPLSRLVAVGVLFRRGYADVEVISIGVETASERGWRRPLLAWLKVRATALERAGKTQEASAVRRRIELVENGALTPP